MLSVPRRSPRRKNFWNLTSPPPHAHSTVGLRPHLPECCFNRRLKTLNYVNWYTRVYSHEGGFSTLSVEREIELSKRKNYIITVVALNRILLSCF